jgi:predicted GNAT family acetyltransferase
VDGFASAAVAHLSAHLSAHGHRACLFTDLANPTSNAIYQRLGYQPLVDMANHAVR